MEAAIRAFVMPGSSTSSSSNVEINIGTATVIITMKTTAATNSTIAG